MLAAGAMTGFAGFLFPALASAGLYCEVRGLLKVIVDFFVAGLASIRANVAGRLGGVGRLSGFRRLSGLLRGCREARGQDHDTRESPAKPPGGVIEHMRNY